MEDHILLSIPYKSYRKREFDEDKMPSGNDWEVVTQEALEGRRKQQKKQPVDPRLESLQSFFEKDETEKVKALCKED